MSQPDKNRADTETARQDRELSDAELAAVSAAGEPTKGPGKGPGPDGDQKKPEPKGM